MYYLLIKTHNKTGLKYLCKHTTESIDGCYKYPGSGKYWKLHLKKHGKDLSTEILFETDNLDKFEEKGLYYSDLYNIVKSDNWANLVPENGRGPMMRGEKHPMFGKFGKDNPNFGRRRSEETKRKMSEVRKGIIFSEEHLKNLSLSHKGQRPWMKGKHCSEETKQKISKALMGEKSPWFGREHTLEAKEKMSNARIGMKFSDEHKENLSISHKGKTTWIRGKHHSEETKQKISKANSGKIGWKHTPESKRKLSIALMGNKNGRKR
jgi:hypothetical protein